MTRIRGYELIGSPCCRTIYAKARFSSVNFSSSAFWTDGNLFQSSHSVTRRPWVTQAALGISAQRPIGSWGAGQSRRVCEIARKRPSFTLHIGSIDLVQKCSAATAYRVSATRDPDQAILECGPSDSVNGQCHVWQLGPPVGPRVVVVMVREDTSSLLGSVAVVEPGRKELRC